MREVLAGVDVYKNQSADQIEGGLESVSEKLGAGARRLDRVGAIEIADLAVEIERHHVVDRAAHFLDGGIGRGVALIDLGELAGDEAEAPDAETEIVRPEEVDRRVGRAQG